MKQETALNILKSGKNVFLTGAPGTGKTYVVNQYIDYIRKHELFASVTASTGIAASHIGGMTLHSFAGLGISSRVTEDDLKHILKKRHVVTRLRKVNILIIDEVSMVLPSVFEAVDTVLKRVKMSTLPFGGVQILMSGDFFQLPPVGRDQEVKYVWQANLWEELDPVVCYLGESYRHEDDNLLKILSEMRQGDVSEEAKELLGECYKREIAFDGVTRLYTHNADVDRINVQELGKLPGVATGFRAGKKGRDTIVDAILGSTLIMPVCSLKEGARVVFIRNNQEKDYVNGTLGVVEGFEADTGFPCVRTYDGRIIVAEPEEWVREADDGSILGGVRQIPLRLAWALTVHKSQGMTLDAAEIDLSRSFETGQGYVALSRIRSLEGLRLLGANEKALLVDDLVREFDRALEERSSDAEEEDMAVGGDQRQEDWENLILKYGGVLSPQESVTTKGGAKSQKTSTIDKTYELLKKDHTLDIIALKRDLKLGTIISHVEQLLEKGVDVGEIDLDIDSEIVSEVLRARDVVSKRGGDGDFTADGEVRLGAIYEELDGVYLYDEIKKSLLSEKFEQN